MSRSEALAWERNHDNGWLNLLNEHGVRIGRVCPPDHHGNNGWRWMIWGTESHRSSNGGPCSGREDGQSKAEQALRELGLLPDQMGTEQALEAIARWDALGGPNDQA